MCQTSLTRSVCSFSYNFSPVSWILQFSSSCIMHQVNNFALHKFSWRLVYQGREHHCSVCCYSSRYLFVSFVLQVSTHPDMASNSKKQTLYTKSITELILDPDSDSDFLTMTNLAVMCMTTWHDEKDQPVASNQRVYIPGQKIRQMEGLSKTKRATKPLPHTSPDTLAWRKRPSAMNPRIPQFTGDKTADTHMFTS